MNWSRFITSLAIVLCVVVTIVLVLSLFGVLK